MKFQKKNFMNYLSEMNRNLNKCQGKKKLFRGYVVIGECSYYCRELIFFKTVHRLLMSICTADCI